MLESQNTTYGTRVSARFCKHRARSAASTMDPQPGGPGVGGNHLRQRQHPPPPPPKTRIVEFNPLNLESKLLFSSLLEMHQGWKRSKACLPSIGHTGTHLSALGLETGRPCREDSEVGFSEAVTGALCRDREAVWWGVPPSRLLELPLARLRT